MIYYFSQQLHSRAEFCSRVSDPSPRPARRGSPYQLLGKPWGSPLVGDGVEGGVLARDVGVGDDHAVPLVDADAVPTLEPGRERGVLGVREQAPDLAVILQLRAQAVLLLAALARLADLPVPDKRASPVCELGRGVTQGLSHGASASPKG